MEKRDLTFLKRAFRAGALLAAAAALSASPVCAENASELADGAETGDLVYFGMYRQDAEDEKSVTDLVWRVLDISEGDALLITEQCVASLPFEAVYGVQDEDALEDVYWENCSLRSWLNDSFLNTAFSGEEQDCILTVDHAAEDVDPDDRTDDREFEDGETEDRVFLLSASEAERFFADKKDRRACGTDLVENGEDAGIFISEETDCVFWWLRTQGRKRSCALTVGAEGSVSRGGFLLSRMDIGVRPAIWVHIPDAPVGEKGGDPDYEENAAAAAAQAEAEAAAAAQAETEAAAGQAPGEGEGGPASDGEGTDHSSGGPPASGDEQNAPGDGGVNTEGNAENELLEPD